ncbi:MAG TPA: pyridoxamine 5'-phosphate oxidase family protein [Pirellulales bacterium]|nr:pyridoxamine 5'-phosphate oxidase family protein [Pirellulales bacterium]
MVIREMNRDECCRVLAGARLARLACAYGNQPYVVPVSLAYYSPLGGDECLYGFTTLGQKVEWMRANPLVCVEVDEVESQDQWVSVIAFGRFEELSDAPGRNGGRRNARQTMRERYEELPNTSWRSSEQLLAHRLLEARAMWWEPASTAGAARTHRDLAEPFIPIFYKIRIHRVTGHEATRDAPQTISSTVPPVPPHG